MWQGLQWTVERVREWRVAGIHVAGDTSRLLLAPVRAGGSADAVYLRTQGSKQSPAVAVISLPGAGKQIGCPFLPPPAFLPPPTALCSQNLPGSQLAGQSECCNVTEQRIELWAESSGTADDTQHRTSTYGVPDMQ